MAEWYLATYQNSVFSSDLGIIQPSEDYVYKLKNGIQSGESPEKKDWLRITDNKVEEWNGSNWADPDEDLTGLVNGSIYWVYGSIVKYYAIVTNDQIHYLEDLTTLNDIGKTNITSVIIGNTVTKINNYAFYECTRLESVTIGNSVTEIGDLAFYQCENLASVIIPDSVTSIGDRAFYLCTSLESVTFGENSKLNTINQNAFSGIKINATITISQTVLGNLNTKYSLELTHGTGQSFFGVWSVTLQVPA